MALHAVHSDDRGPRHSAHELSQARQIKPSSPKYPDGQTSRQLDPWRKGSWPVGGGESGGAQGDGGGGGTAGEGVVGGEGGVLGGTGGVIGLVSGVVQERQSVCSGPLHSAQVLWHD